MENEKSVLSIKKLSKQYGPGCSNCVDTKNFESNICRLCGTVHALNNISFNLYEGEIIGIVGESGSGKSTLMKCLFFDETPSTGEIFLSDFNNGEQNILNVSTLQQHEIKNNLLGIVYQNPVLGLKMDFSSMSNIAERMIEGNHMNVKGITERGNTLLNHVNIPLQRAKEAPKNFSGGMQQRVQIAKALSNNPPILLLDEVTTGLDLSVQADVLDLIKTIQRNFNVSMIVVSHDLAVIRMLSDRALVMLNGEIVEQGLTDAILEDPQHPYTQSLVYSLL